MRTICIRVDDETKKQFQEFCDSAGISLSAAITIFLKSVIRENKLPFEIKGTRSI
ncbi:MAG: type II toxin-antitoxin system RelB/DinJ family antitoxin [Fibrobacter sp.]|nr:type II toxin-antitoxin system RelB/DinJ family antitoxin [Fibrobacter sp.]